MPRSYRRKSARGTIPRGVFEIAATDVRMGMSIRGAARVHKVYRMTLTRFIIRSQSGGERSTGYEGTARAHTILTPAMKEDLAAHIKDLGDQFLGLSPDKCYEFAMQNEVLMPDNWKRQQRAGKDWFAGFKRRQNWSCRKPETTSIARVTAFNRNAVTKFFENLEAVGERHTFAPSNTYNLDETGVSTVQTPKLVFPKNK